MERMRTRPADFARSCDSDSDLLRSVAAKLMLASNSLPRCGRRDPAAMHARARVPAQRRLGHIPALDGLRGVAIASVLIYHAGGLSGGYLGVDLFFVLSGFLITSLLLEEHVERGRVSLPNFYIRRVRRLMPVAVAGIVFSEIALLGGYIGWQALSGVSRSSTSRTSPTSSMTRRSPALVFTGLCRRRSSSTCCGHRVSS